MAGKGMAFPSPKNLSHPPAEHSAAFVCRLKVPPATDNGLESERCVYAAATEFGPMLPLEGSVPGDLDTTALGNQFPKSGWPTGSAGVGWMPQIRWLWLSAAYSWRLPWW